jgi:hypothetical protein
VTAGFKARINAAVKVAFTQGLSPRCSSGLRAGSSAASSSAVSSALSARPKEALNGAFSHTLNGSLTALFSRAFSCALSCSFTEAHSWVSSVAATAELRRASNRAVPVRLPGRAAVYSYAQGPICSGRAVPDHNSAVGGAAPRPPGGLQLPMQLKIDWTIEWPVLFPVECAVRWRDQ